MELEVPGQTKRVQSLISKGKDDPKVEEKVVEKKEEEKVQKKQEEPSTHVLSNPARIAEKQRQHITFQASRYSPVLPNRKLGISFLKDSQPG